MENSFKIVAYPGAQLLEVYRPMVFSKWLRSLRHGNDYFKLVDSDSYYKAYSRYLESLLSRPGVTVKLAVLSDDADVCLGFSVLEGATLHYVIVQRDYRGNGVGRLLMGQDVAQITHLTKTGLKVWAKKFPKAKFNPFYGA